MQRLIGHLENARTAPAPAITCYPAAPASRCGIGLVIFPGGGYGGLADHEGQGYAEHFAAEGIACFVVTYRLGPAGHRHPAMLEDALAAVTTVRARAAELGVDPRKIGVMGSSAGGHLAAHAVVAGGAHPGAISARPDFGVLCYPVIRMQGPHCHQGSRLNLLGPDPAASLLEEVSPDERVSPQTPPCFLWHTGEDQSVPAENSMLFAAALRRCGVPFELHVYQRGQHGLGLATDFAWAADCRRWVRQITAGPAA